VLGGVEPLQARARCIVVGRSGIGELDYLGSIQYVLRRRDRSGFWTAIFLFALSAALLTVATVSVATGYTSVAGVWDFLVFGLLMAAGGIFVLRDRTAIAGQVLMAAGDAGIYLAEPPQCIPWPEVAGLVVFRTWQDGDDAGSGKWLSQMAVGRGQRRQAGIAVWRHRPRPDDTWAAGQGKDARGYFLRH